ncbi:MAG: reverse transcriptase family protein [Oscillospiraceae bacterium]
MKSCASSLAYPISFIINKSLKDGIFPDKWKLSHVVPIHKKGDKQLKVNYRPISLLSNTSKVLERIVYNIYNYCITNDILTHKNSGFKKFDGTINQLLHLVNKIYMGFDNEMEIAVIFLDVTKAFDRVWHEGLLLKLNRIGIKGNLFKWCQSYLSNRRQKVVINGQFSDIFYVLAGVPQGSILGPLLFLIFINDLVNDIECDMNLFADDTMLLEAYKDSILAQLKLNRDLIKIENWAKNWLVNFNPEKTEFINFSLKKHKSVLKLNFKGQIIKQVTEHKHLGILFSNDLKWQKHINYITSKASQKLGLMYRSSTYLNRHQLISVYQSMIRPALEYGSVLYDNCTIADIEKLENIQRRAALICSGAMRRTESAKLMRLLEWTSLANRRKLAKLLLFFKIINHLTPSYLLCNLQCRVNTQNLRNHKMLHFVIPSSRLMCYKKSFFPSVLSEWNRLPDDFDTVTSLTLFKNKIIQFFNLMPPVNDCVLFDSSFGYYGKLLNQLKLGLSPLHHHLFIYNIMDNPFCPNCFDCIEDAGHYFLKCFKYADARRVFLNSLQVCVNSVLSITLYTDKDLLNFILNGVHIDDSKLQRSVNDVLFTVIRTYIKSTARFSKD